MPRLISTSIILFVLFYSTAVVPVSSVPTPTGIWQLEVRHEGHDGTPSPSVAGSTPSASAVGGDFRKQNGLDAQKLNAQFKTLKATDGCQDGQQACVESQFAQCVAGKWALTACAAGTSCFALPLVNKPGTSLTCDTSSDASARFEAAGVQGGPDGLPTGNGSPSVSANVPVATGSTDPDADDGNEPCNDSDETDDDSSDGTDDGDTDCDADSGSPSSSRAPAPKPQATPSSSTPASGPITITTTVTSLPTDSARVAINNAVFTRMTVARRQLFTTSPLSTSPLPSSSSIVVSSQASPVVIQSSPSIPVVTATPSASNGVVTPTVVVGNNGIVTVMVVSVSTVTVSATDCAVSSSSATPVTILASATSSPSAVIPSSISNTVGQNPTLVSPSPSPSVLITLEAGSSSSTANTNGGLFFSTQTFTPTSASSPTQGGNISELLTATL